MARLGWSTPPNVDEYQTQSSDNIQLAKPSKLFLNLIAMLALSLASAPYLYAWLRREDRIYLWMGYNFDDVCVYLSYIRQAASGSIRVFNEFTTEPQSGMLANPFFYALGLISKFTTLAPISVFHTARVLFGGLLFFRLGKLLKALEVPAKAYAPIFALTAFSAGLGWLPGLWALTGEQSPIDKWQPEAITFLSLLLNPLFLASMCLQLFCFEKLWLACKANSRREAIMAGGGLALLALVHTYDVISLATVWLLIVIAVAAKRIPGLSLATIGKPLTTASICTLPFLIIQWLQAKSNPLFAARIGVETLSPSFAWVLAGFLPLLILGAFNLRKSSNTPIWNYAGIMALWFFGQVIAAYLPVPYQRKMLQGAHLPLCILAGIGLSKALEKLNSTKHLLATASVTLVLALTNVRFIMREMTNSDSNLAQTGLHRPYISEAQLKAIKAVGDLPASQSGVQALPVLHRVVDEQTGRSRMGVIDLTLAILTPALTGHHAYGAHFGETPDIKTKLGELIRLTSATMPLADRQALLRDHGINVLLFSQSTAETSEDRNLTSIFQNGLQQLTDFEESPNSSATVAVYRRK